jgi:Flp pilus assembly protein TadG
MQPGTSRDTDGVNAGPASDSMLNQAQPHPPRLARRGGKGVRSRERGQSTAEFVIILPFLLLFLFLIVDFGWLLKNYIVVTNTARETARCTTVRRCVVDGNEAASPIQLAQERIKQGLGSNIFDGATFDVEYVGGDEKGDSLMFCIKADNEYISPVIPFLSMVTGVPGDTIIPDPLPLKARAEMRVERPASAGPMTASIPVGDGTCDNF